MTLLPVQALRKLIFRWRKQDLPQASHIFSGSQLGLSDEPDISLHYFSMLFTDKLIQDIIENTNLHSEYQSEYLR